MLLFSALWLAVVQALTSLAVPAPLAGAAYGPSRVASVSTAASKVADSASAIARSEAADTEELRRGLGDEEFRPPAPHRSLVVDRTSNRSVPPLRSPVGLDAFTSPDLAVSLASARTRAAHCVSHAVAARGGHLPYYPTAPPLQD